MILLKMVVLEAVVHHKQDLLVLVLILLVLVVMVEMDCHPLSQEVL